MIVSINQPAYLPWLGYFHRIAVSDLHIVLDHVQFEKNSFTNRNQVRTANGPCWLTVPVATKGKFGDLSINKLEIAKEQRWADKHWGTLRANYRKAPFFAEHAPFFEQVYQKPWDRLSDLMNEITAYLLRAFCISTPLSFSSKMKAGGRKDELVLNLCREAGAATYLSGPLGRNYLHEEAFSATGIKVAYQDYQHPSYPQVYPGFESHMAAIDLLFNCGSHSREVLLSGQ